MVGAWETCVITVSMTNLDTAFGSIDKWLTDVKSKTERRVKGLTMYATKWLATHSPQYSGDFAANWRVAVNGVDTSFTQAAVNPTWVDPLGRGFGIELFKQGDRPAIDYALSNMTNDVTLIDLGDYVTISNSAQHGADKYAWKIENNKINFRPENHEGGRVIGRFMESIRSLPV